jgi:hypothetical protein
MRSYATLSQIEALRTTNNQRKFGRLELELRFICSLRREKKFEKSERTRIKPNRFYKEKVKVHN